MKAAIIINPIAGRGNAGRDKIAQAFQKHGVESDILATQRPGHGTELAKKVISEESSDIIVAAGGDGTVNDVVNGIEDSGFPLGLLPLGSVNVLARELKIPLQPEKAIQTIARGHTKLIDLGNANSRRFTLMAGFGFDAEVVANVLQPIKDWIGSSAYALKALETLAKYEATEITLEMPEETYTAKAFLVIAANVSTYSYNLKITPHALPDDGKLDICVFEKPITDRFGFLHQVADVFMHKHLYHKAVRYFKTTSVTIRSKPDILVQLDGDTCAVTPIRISISPRILKVIVPPSK